ncbi:MAG TPA: pentapeptide repeat-containing protein [Cyclobacteriaceae bacterium]|jgi:uncharacterized protein YjbI with pentapeptide repeats
MAKQFFRLYETLSKISEKPILTSFIVLLLTAILVIGMSLPYYLGDFKNFYAQILAEAHGMIFDIAVIGILIFWLNRRGEVRQRIRTYRDEIDDFRLWESEEAAFRTVGNIKRLNRHNIFRIDLVETYLARTNLNHIDLEESNLNSANIRNSFLIQANLKKTRLNQTCFENANLNQADLSDSYAGGANFKDAFLIKTNLRNSFLIKANFVNAFLMEADLSGTHLTGANLENASLYKADLRSATGITVEQLSKAKTLYQAKLDPEIAIEMELQFPELLGIERPMKVG